MSIIIVIGSARIAFHKGYIQSYISNGALGKKSPPAMNIFAIFDIIVASLMRIKRYLTTSEEQHLFLPVGSILQKL